MARRSKSIDQMAADAARQDADAARQDADAVRQDADAVRQDDGDQNARAAGKSEASAATAPVVAAVTPMMAQYCEIKAANPDCLLFYRMGDFYELFFEDAVTASEALGITLTKRGRHLGDDIPMCGVPVHAADDYLQRLIRRGFRVAVCEQTEDPAEAKKRGSKSVVRRDVVRLVTPGTLTEDNLLDARANNFLTALFIGPAVSAGDAAAATGKTAAALASIDISTGQFLLSELDRSDLAGELARLQPGEVIVADSALADQVLKDLLHGAGTPVTPVPRAFFDSLSGERELKSRLGVAELGGLGAFSRLELAAIGAVLKYLDLTQIGQRPLIRRPERAGLASNLMIDAATRANLEIIRTSSGEKRGSLLDAIDRTVTGPGARELAARLSSPLADLGEINARLDAVGFLLEEVGLRSDLREALRLAPDLARSLSRLAVERAGPRDLAVVRDGLAAAGAIAGLLAKAASGLGLPDALASAGVELTPNLVGLQGELTSALAAELPALRRDGGFIRAGYAEQLDENRRLRDQSRRVLAELQARYQNETGIKTLKVRHNNMLGYFVEVSVNHQKALSSPPNDANFIHRQTLANAARFSTGELNDIEGRITAAADRALALEQEIFAKLAAGCLAASAELASIASAIAALDVYSALAELAEAERYVRPRLDQGLSFEIRGGRHPVVEQALAKARSGPFIENDCLLDRSPVPATNAASAATAKGKLKSDKNSPATSGWTAEQDSDANIGGFDEAHAGRIWLVTGPNMAGKSTFLRQNALIAIMAQMGSFVPARMARIGLVDRLFSRVGASDDLARGRSTFMVEMVETAGILNQASERSLVILDEIGRGTATFDGLSIAWATVEYLNAVSRCRALFATHYHELTALAGRLPDVANVTIEVKEWKGEIVFLHRVVPGAADRSYGIQVAKLAGLPAPVIERAGEVLRLLEQSDERVKPEDLIADLPLFAASRPKGHAPVQAAPSPLLDAFAAIKPDDLTPREALDALYKLKALVI